VKKTRDNSNPTGELVDWCLGLRENDEKIEKHSCDSFLFVQFVFCCFVLYLPIRSWPQAAFTVEPRDWRMFTFTPAERSVSANRCIVPAGGGA